MIRSEYNCLTVTDRLCIHGSNPKRQPCSFWWNTSAHKQTVPLFSPWNKQEVSWDCGLRTIAMALISSDLLLRTESLQYQAQPAVSAQERLCCGMRFCGLKTTSRSANQTLQCGYWVQLHLATGLSDFTFWAWAHLVLGIQGHSASVEGTTPQA